MKIHSHNFIMKEMLRSGYDMIRISFNDGRWWRNRWKFIALCLLSTVSLFLLYSYVVENFYDYDYSDSEMSSVTAMQSQSTSAPDDFFDRISSGKKKLPGQSPHKVIPHDYLAQCYNGVAMSRCFYRYHHHMLSCAAFLRQTPGYANCTYGRDRRITESVTRWFNASRQFHDSFLGCLSLQNLNATKIGLILLLNANDMAAAAVCATWHAKETHACWAPVRKCKFSNRCWNTKETIRLRHAYRRATEVHVATLTSCMNYTFFTREEMMYRMP